MRTREEQARAIAAAIEDVGVPDKNLVRLMAKELAEAENRGMEEVRKDTERLDWLEKQPKVMTIDGKRLRVGFYSPQIGPFESLRDAIDSAISAKPGELK